MSATDSRRLAVVIAVGVAFAPLLVLSAADPAPVKTAHYKGKVVPLASLLEKIGSKIDPDAAPHWLALVTDDGKIYPLIKDDGARMFFNDAKLQNRAMRLTGRLFKDTHLLQILDVHSYVKGKLHEVYYWCDICSIRRRQKQICDCCGGPMELKEVPLTK
jgi:hypothetical protein